MSRDLPDTLRGYQPHEVVSAMQKAIRRSQVKEANYWAVELHNSGYTAWLWKRLDEILSEDIGPADRYLPAQIAALRDTCMGLAKKGGGNLQVVHAVTLMATAKKSRLVCRIAISENSDHHERYEIPDEALDRHTRRGRQMGRGVDHFLDEAAKLIDPPADVEAHLAEVDREYAEHRRRLIRRDATLPNNPWRRDVPTRSGPPTGKPAQNSQPPTSGQVRQLELRSDR